VSDVPDNDTVSRYCKPSAVGQDGRPLSAAFRLRPGEDYLSVNWLEFFDAPDIAVAVECVREVFRNKGYRLRPNGRFAVVGVSPAKAVVAETVGHPGRVEHLPLDDDESHAGLSGYTAHELAVAVGLRALVQSEHVHPAVPPR